MTYPPVGREAKVQDWLTRARTLCEARGLTVEVVSNGGTPGMWQAQEVPAATELCRVLTDFDAVSWTLAASFNGEALEALRRLCPQTPTSATAGESLVFFLLSGLRLDAAWQPPAAIPGSPASPAGSGDARAPRWRRPAATRSPSATGRSACRHGHAEPDAGAAGAARGRHAADSHPGEFPDHSGLAARGKR